MPTLPKRFKASLALTVIALKSGFSKVAPVRLSLPTRLLACATEIAPVTVMPAPKDLTALAKVTASAAVRFAVPVTLALLKLTLPARVSAPLLLIVLSLIRVAILKILLLTPAVDSRLIASAEVTMLSLILVVPPSRPASAPPA